MSSQNRKPNKTLAVVMITVLCTVIVSTVGFMLLLSENKIEGFVPVGATTEEQTTEPPLPYKESTVTIGSAGDVLMHLPILNSAKRSDGYNFDSIFTYTSSLIKKCDYFVANLETTLGGADYGSGYTSYPCFNSPDDIAVSMKNAGVDGLLTANNHSYDTRGHGVGRTLSVVKGLGFDTVGSRENESDKKHFVKNIGGIKFGFACYTYETETSAGRKALNGILVDEATAKLINSFDYTKIDNFYTEISSELSAMKGEGAEVTVVYIHWGNEYQLTPNSHQKNIAQKLCDMGVDVIIGGHPHVVQPVDLITSTDGKHKTVCVYSVGNMISNQRRNLMGLKTGHTEDGLIFQMTFSKYSDGTVTFDKVKSVPTWVHLYSSNGRNVYNVVPLSSNLDAAALGLNKSSNGLSLAKASYERTMELVKDGTKKCNSYLSSLAKPDDVPETTEAAA